DSHFYIDRPPIEDLACREILKSGSVTRIKAPKRMGKSSLLAKILDRARKEGFHTINIDFQQTDESIFSSIDRFLRWFCKIIARQLKLEPLLDEFWDEDIGSKVSCTLYFEGYLLEEIETPIVVALNEVNRIFEHPAIAQDFLPLLRSWHEQAKQGTAFEKLRLVVVHSTEIYVPLNLNQSPFNVGLPIKVPLFTLEQVQALALLYELEWAAGEEGLQRLQPLIETIGGHPYLIQLAFYHLRRETVTLEQLLQEAPTEAGIYSNHLRELWGTLQKEPELAEAYEEIVATPGRVRLESIAAYKLYSMGLIALEGSECTCSCELYRLYFSAQLGLYGDDDISESNLATIIFTDVVGSTEKMVVDQIHLLTLIQRDFQVMGDICREYEGKVLKSMGDGLLIYFASAVKAVSCAIAMQKSLKEAGNGRSAQEILYHRMGIHLGDVCFSGKDVLGLGVNIAARLQGKADPGGICLSQTVYDAIADNLSVQVQDMGEQGLKGMAQPVRLYRVIP
ncbi:AAA-like domain-containing protein, partial [Spirulina sp. 06S082]|uniref:AAA-like domain-containing protein n=1 Tax=Spirulina sp. 06S082 TaxID=3110248 RepID=UPI002B1F39CC